MSTPTVKKLYEVRSILGRRLQWLAEGPEDVDGALHRLLALWDVVTGAIRDLEAERRLSAGRLRIVRQAIAEADQLGDPAARALLAAEIVASLLDEETLGELLEERSRALRPASAPGTADQRPSSSRGWSGSKRSLLQGGKVTANKAKKLSKLLAAMTVEDLHQLKREQGLGASGAKADLVAKLAERIRRGPRRSGCRHP